VSRRGSALPSEVASSLAAYYAKLAANEDQPASAAQVDALRQRLSVACETPQFGQYPCTVRAREQPSAAQGCVAFADGTGRVLSARCRGGAGPPPLTRIGYIDCATVGHVVALHDPIGDMTATPPGAQPVAPAPWADLTDVRIAATPRRLCIDFKTAAAPRRWTQLSLFATNPRVSANAPNHEIEPIIDYSDPRLPEVELFSNSAISGQIGSSAGWTSLVITATDIGPFGAGILRTPFLFRAVASYEPRTPGRVTALLTDQTPDDPRQAAYP
jgi:hypothetical protein